MAIGKTSYNGIPLKPIGNTDNKHVTIHRQSSMYVCIIGMQLSGELRKQYVSADQVCARSAMLSASIEDSDTGLEDSDSSETGLEVSDSSETGLEDSDSSETGLEV